MKRRSVLAALGSGVPLTVAGCTSVSSSAEPDTDRRVVRLASVDDVPEEHDVELSVEVRRSSIDAEQTARLAVSTTNTGERRTLSVSPDMCSLFNRSRDGSDDPEGLWLHRADSTDSIERDGNHWVADRPSDDPGVYPSYRCLAAVYDTGETVTNEYELWDDYRVAGYMDTGTYRWEERVRVFAPDDEARTSSGEEELGSFEWGFDVELSVPQDT